MSSQKEIKPKIFLIVTIQTHLRVLMDTADLLHESGRYKPIIIYYPSALFDQNFADCQKSRYDCYIWNNSSFLSKKNYMLGEWKNKKPPSPSKLKLFLMNLKRIIRLKETPWKTWLNQFKNSKYILKLSKKYSHLLFRSFLQRISYLLKGINVLTSVAFKFYWISVLIIKKITNFKFDIGENKEDSNLDIPANNKNYNKLQSLILRIFAYTWKSIQDPENCDSITNTIFNYVMGSSFFELTLQKKFFREISILLDSENPKLVILPEENLFYHSQFITYAAHLRSIPVAIIPYTIVNVLEWAESFYNIKSYQANYLWNRVFAIAFPHWVLIHRDRRLILPAIYILGCEYFNMTPKNPWLINSGHSDVIASESQFMTEYYLEAGIEAKKIHFTGATTDDKLYSLLSNKKQQLSILEKDYNLSIKNKILLIGLPPNQFKAGKRKGCEFDNFNEMISFIVNTAIFVANNKATVLINLHPRIDYAEIQWLESLNIKIIQEPIEKLMPLADIYIAAASATIRLGVSCGIPVINYDVYQYDYNDFKNLKGVCEVKTKVDYEKMISVLINNDKFYSNIKMAQAETAKNKCRIDGKAGLRTLQLIDQLTSAV